MAISDGSWLVCLPTSDCDIGLVGYEMTLLVDRVGDSTSRPSVRNAGGALPPA